MEDPLACSRFFFSWSCREGSATRSTYCSFTGSGFRSQHPCGSSQLPITSVLGKVMPSNGLFGHLTCTWYTHIFAGKIFIHIKNKRSKSKDLFILFFPLKFPPHYWTREIAGREWCLSRTQEIAQSLAGGSSIIMRKPTRGRSAHISLLSNPLNPDL